MVLCWFGKRAAKRETFQINVVELNEVNTLYLVLFVDELDLHNDSSNLVSHNVISVGSIDLKQTNI